MKPLTLERMITVPVGPGIDLIVPRIDLDAAGQAWATVEAWGDRLVHQDQLVLARAPARRRYARIVSAKGDVSEAEVEEALLALSARAATILGPGRTAPVDGDEEVSGHVSYAVQDGGLVCVTPQRDGAPRTIRLTNFTARIVEDLLVDDGAHPRRLVRIEAALQDRTTTFEVPAEGFPRLRWAIEHLGTGAIVYPGPGTTEHLRVAIQTLSGAVPERVVYAHLGWRRVGGSWVYLHAGGAIGANGAVPEVGVSLPDALARYVLPTPLPGDLARAAFQSSLGILRVGPPAVTYPALAAVYRAPLGDADFTIHVVGPSGIGKTELAALLQQHWGPAMDARHLPAGWDSTSNALEALAHAAKDALLVVDDFAPGGTAQDESRRHRDADRLLRAQGNQAGRSRLSASTALQAPTRRGR